MSQINKVDEPIDGDWYWVTDMESVWVACASKSAAGGWTNQDTWEDFEKRVVSWVHIKKPHIDEFAQQLE